MSINIDIGCCTAMVAIDCAGLDQQIMTMELKPGYDLDEHARLCKERSALALIVAKDIAWYAAEEMGK